MLKNWKDASGKKRHLIKELCDNGSDLVVSKWWRVSKQRWEYVIEEKYLVEYVIGLRK